MHLYFDRGLNYHASKRFVSPFLLQVEDRRETEATIEMRAPTLAEFHVLQSEYTAALKELEERQEGLNELRSSKDASIFEHGSISSKKVDQHRAQIYPLEDFER